MYIAQRDRDPPTMKRLGAPEQGADQRVHTTVGSQWGGDHPNNKFFKANADRVDSMNEKLVKEGKPCSFGTNDFFDFSDEEWENYGTPADDLVEFDKLFRSKSFVSLEDLRELNARLEREGKEKRSSGAWQSKHWFR